MPSLLITLFEWKFEFQTIDWRVISAIAAIVGIVLVFYFQWYRNRKRFSYDIVSNVLVVSAEKAFKDKVEIRYEGVDVKNVTVLVVKIINDGYQPIRKDDFEKPFKLVFPEATILTAEKVEFHPENLGANVHYRDDWFEMDPTLFNRKEFFQYKILLSGYTKMKVDARIVGVSKIGKVRKGIWGNSESHFGAADALGILFIICAPIVLIGFGTFIMHIISLNAGVEMSYLTMIGLPVGILVVGVALMACISRFSSV